MTEYNGPLEAIDSYIHSVRYDMVLFVPAKVKLVCGKKDKLDDVMVKAVEW